MEIIKHVNNKKIEELVKNIIIPESSIGVHVTHSTNNLNSYQVYEKVLKEGFKARGGYLGKGLISTIAFAGPTDYYDTDLVMNWNYGDEENGDYCKFIFAIPRTFKITGGREYFIGTFPTREPGEDFKDFTYFGYNRVGIVPSEFIVGCIRYKKNDIDYSNGKRITDGDLIINPNYIGLKSERERQEFYDSYGKKIERVIYALNDYNYNLIQEVLIKDDLFKNDYYFKDYIRYYQTRCMKENNSRK